jgi:hypothetical protein
VQFDANRLTQRRGALMPVFIGLATFAASASFRV